ncbi:hypothetical protein [Streptomyces sp. NBC_01750]|uniref:hypothetical protein n=1 Tax=Streptomyces sp. NBC_01750 TaxID=2975928 RepID=UPI002DD89BD8|nr:hypothetical protein [Streptomyces sp. NBC_01750]WSD33581.1 hypothetical protein OG966_17745 [Streptomyces sp. NBC_01750]
MKTARITLLAALSAAALVPVFGQPRAGAPTVQAPGGYTDCAYSSSTSSTSDSPADGSCDTTPSRPSDDRSRRSHIV